MRDWITNAQALRDTDQASLIDHLATLHGRFEQVHPFLDGNGRAGRLVLNLLVIRLGYPPATIYKADRPRYLSALRRYDAGDPTPLSKLLTHAILHNLHRFLIQPSPAQTG
jgi:Fic family protein